MSPRLRPLPAERLQRIWGRLHMDVRNNGGWITTQPNEFPARMECKVGNSDLLELLKEKGWIISNGGTTETFMPQSIEDKQLGTNTKVQHDVLAPTVVSIFWLELP